MVISTLATAESVTSVIIADKDFRDNLLQQDLPRLRIPNTNQCIRACRYTV